MSASKVIFRRPLLVAFDFDHTIVEENSDIVARKLIHPDLIPETVRKLYQDKGWTDYMSEIFKLLHIHNVSKETILESMKKLTPTDNMLELLRWLSDAGHETIIISDSNSVFISEWLSFNQLEKCVRRVFTNPASFKDNGLLTLEPYQHQDWCKLSTKNLCKGFILEDYIKQRYEEGKIFEATAYVGDGHNDFCPSLKLTENDFVFPRIGFPLCKVIEDPNQDEKVTAKVYPWRTGRDILDTLKKVQKTHILEGSIPII